MITLELRLRQGPSGGSDNRLYNPAFYAVKSNKIYFTIHFVMISVFSPVLH